jgi:N-dimethylarginine dimethylaminohydrolase
MRVLMCPPTYFDVPLEDKEKNPWMSVRRKPNFKIANTQWKNLARVYKTLGLKVEVLDPEPGLFDQVFTANIAWHKGNKAVIARLAPEWRRGEEAVVREWFIKEEYQVIDLPESLKFEGQGDVISIGEAGYLFCYGIRNNFEVMEFLEKTFDLRGKFIPLRLVNPEFYHGDVCIRYSPYRNALLYNPSAFDAESLRRIEALPVAKMEAPRNLWVQETPDGRNFPLNGCYIGDIVSEYETFPWDDRVAEFPRKVANWILSNGGSTLRAFNFDQFGLSGAGHRCCTYFLD